MPINHTLMEPPIAQNAGIGTIVLSEETREFMKKILILLILSSMSIAKTTTFNNWSAEQAMPWHATEFWDNGLPEHGDDVIIRGLCELGSCVNYPYYYNLNSLTIEIGALYTYSNTYLRADTCTVHKTIAGPGGVLDLNCMFSCENLHIYGTVVSRNQTRVVNTTIHPGGSLDVVSGTCALDFWTGYLNYIGGSIYELIYGLGHQYHPADINQDGFVDLADLNILSANWLKT